jgi:hypothetical protein
MMKRPRRNHSPAFKAKVALAAIKGEKTLGLLAAAHLRHVPSTGGRQPLRAGPQHGHVGEDAGAVLRTRLEPCDGERTHQEQGEREDAAVGVKRISYVKAAFCVCEGR